MTAMIPVADSMGECRMHAGGAEYFGSGFLAIWDEMERWGWGGGWGGGRGGGVTGGLKICLSLPLIGLWAHFTLSSFVEGLID